MLLINLIPGVRYQRTTCLKQTFWCFSGRNKLLLKLKKNLRTFKNFLHFFIDVLCAHHLWNLQRRVQRARKLAEIIRDAQKVKYNILTQSTATRSALTDTDFAQTPPSDKQSWFSTTISKEASLPLQESVANTTLQSLSYRYCLLSKVLKSFPPHAVQVAAQTSFVQFHFAPSQVLCGMQATCLHFELEAFITVFCLSIIL